MLAELQTDMTLGIDRVRVNDDEHPITSVCVSEDEGTVCIQTAIGQKRDVTIHLEPSTMIALGHMCIAAGRIAMEGRE